VSSAEVERRGELRSEADVLRYLGLDPAAPATVALFALARRYGLDPLLRQVEVLATKQGPRAYISRDGYLALAHRTGELRGIRTLEAREGEHGWAATVEVRTVDGGEYVDSAGCAFDEGGVTRDGPNTERMAIARAERRALKRAFSALPAQHGDDPPTTLREAAPRAPWATSAPAVEAEQWPPVNAGAPATSPHARQREARLAFNTLDAEQRDAFIARHALDDLGAPWPAAALAELLDARRSDV
jgi:hypothetical protein